MKKPSQINDSAIPSSNQAAINEIREASSQLGDLLLQVPGTPNDIRDVIKATKLGSTESTVGVPFSDTRAISIAPDAEQSKTIGAINLLGNTMAIYMRHKNGTRSVVLGHYGSSNPSEIPALIVESKIGIQSCDCGPVEKYAIYVVSSEESARKGFSSAKTLGNRLQMLFGKAPERTIEKNFNSFITPDEVLHNALVAKMLPGKGCEIHSGTSDHEKIEW